MLQCSRSGRQSRALEREGPRSDSGVQARERVMWRQQDKRVRWWVKDRWACEAEADGGEESTEDGELELCDVELDLIQLPKSTLAR